MNLDSMYQDVILDHYKNPQYAGLREPYQAEVHHVNPSCGDELTLRVRLSDDGKTVEDVSYDAEGNEKLAEFEKMITSRGQDEGDEDLIGDGVAFAGVSQYPARVKCALLGWKAFQAASADALTEVES